MTKLIVTSKTKERMTFHFKNEASIVTFIKNISTRDLREKKYAFSAKGEKQQEQLVYFFNNTYNQNFFTFSGGNIILNIMPNGIHRELKSKARRSFNNRILKRALLNIMKDANCDLEKKYLKFNDDRYHFMRFTQLHETFFNGKFERKEAFIEVGFDKLEWSYTLGNIFVYDAKFLLELKSAMEKYTKYLREHRKKKLK